MKNSMSIVLSCMAVVALSGCGGGGTNGDADVPIGPDTFVSVDVLDLRDGFIIDGRNNAGEDVTLQYCNNQYEYYSGPGHWWGTFNINGDRINMFDQSPTGGSYRIDTINNRLEVGQVYYIDFQNDEIIVEQITEDLNC